MAELYQLQEQEIPEAMGRLQDSHGNLKKVADYCEGLYLQAADVEKKPALEETRGYTTQALASVAYQINTLATSFLSLLDLQARQLIDMESSINHLSQTVSIHKEKVARREIGVLTTNKAIFRPIGVKTPGIIFPEQVEKPIKYIRKPIDYTMLDSVGCGGPKTQILGQRRPPSVSSTTSSGHGTVSRHASNTPSVAGTLPRVARYSSGQAGRQNSGPIAPPVAPPSVPSHYMSAQQLQNAQQSGVQTGLANPTYGMLQAPSVIPPAPPIVNGRVDGLPYPTAGENVYNGDMAPPPPLAPLSPPLPPMPPSSDEYSMNQAPYHRHPPNNYNRFVPNMPPPPPEEDSQSMPRSSFPVYPDTSDQDAYDMASLRGSIPIPPPIADQAGGLRGVDPPWAPDNYMEKVVAIFDYEPQNDDELRFRENTILYVIKKNSDGWWEGVMESHEGQPVCGLFPENYVESLL